jgi:hypothetical protein
MIISLLLRSARVRIAASRGYRIAFALSAGFIAGGS